jgi:hypothetical protein
MYKGEDKQILRFTLANELDTTVHILKWHTPLDGFNDDMFRVERNGTLSVYMGRVVKRGAPRPEDYIEIKPKSEISVKVDLSEAYDIFEAGSYGVEFKTSRLDFGTESSETLAKNLMGTRDIVSKEVKSNTARFDLLESKAPRQFKGIALDQIRGFKEIAAKGLAFKNCSAN